ncbi:unnamed protein product [Penicillium manginii]
MDLEKELPDHTEEAQSGVFLDDREEYDYFLSKFDKERRNKLLRKIDWRLLPILSLFYLISFMDRANIGNAKLQGLEEDLNLTPGEYNWALTIFFFPYGAFEVPSNLALKFTKPSIWIPIIMLSWGLVMMCMGWVQDYSGILATRFFLGVTEAGLFPGVTYLCSTWYCRYELQFRIALFYCAASLAGSFSGLLAYGIGFMDGIRGYSGWRWIFILEGVLTIIVALVSHPFICDDPGSSAWLTIEEKRFISLRLQFDGHDSGYKESAFQKYHLKQAFLDTKVYLGCILFTIVSLGTYALSFSLPTTIKILGYTAAQAQLMTIPVYAFASIMCVLNAWVSDRLGRRYHAVVIPYLIGIIGFIICITVDPEEKPGVIYLAMFFIATSLFPTTPSVVCWMSNNLSGQWKRAVGMALTFTGGNLIGGVVGSNIFLARESPNFHTAYYIMVAVFGAGIFVATFKLWLLIATNKKRGRLIESMPEERLAILDEDTKSLGDKSPFFRYTL